MFLVKKGNLKAKTLAYKCFQANVNNYVSLKECNFSVKNTKISGLISKRRIILVTEKKKLNT
jgi:hypothetical protein